MSCLSSTLSLLGEGVALDLTPLALDVFDLHRASRHKSLCDDRSLLRGVNPLNRFNNLGSSLRLISQESQDSVFQLLLSRDLLGSLLSSPVASLLRFSFVCSEQLLELLDNFLSYFVSDNCFVGFNLSHFVLLSPTLRRWAPVTLL